jgi:hypothetical protein
MDAFLAKHRRKIAGTLSCVDRIVFKGYLPISWADSFVKFLYIHFLLRKIYRTFDRRF